MTDEVEEAWDKYTKAYHKKHSRRTRLIEEETIRKAIDKLEQKHEWADMYFLDTNELRKELDLK